MTCRILHEVWAERKPDRLVERTALEREVVPVLEDIAALVEMPDTAQGRQN